MQTDDTYFWLTHFVSFVKCLKQKTSWWFSYSNQNRCQHSVSDWKMSLSLVLCGSIINHRKETFKSSKWKCDRPHSSSSLSCNAPLHAAVAILVAPTSYFTCHFYTFCTGVSIIKWRLNSCSLYQKHWYWLDSLELFIIIIIIQHLYSALKSCKGYGGAVKQ